MAFHDDMIYKQGSFHGPLGQYDRNKVLSMELQHATVRYPTNYQCCTVKENVVLGGACARAHNFTVLHCCSLRFIYLRFQIEVRPIVGNSNINFLGSTTVRRTSNRFSNGFDLLPVLDQIKEEEVKKISIIYCVAELLFVQRACISNISVL
jgi:hypothetical protein